MGATRARFEALVAELRGRSDLRVSVAELGAPATDAQIATARRYAGILPDGMEPLYREMNGFHLAWEGPGVDGVPDRGAAQLLPIERVFGSWQGVVWFPGDPGGERFRELYPFDLFQDEVCAVFRRADDRPPEPRVYLHVLGEDVCPLGRTFPEYVDLLLQARAYVHWQQALAPEMRANPEARRFRARAPALFPGLDPTHFGG